MRKKGKKIFWPGPGKVEVQEYEIPSLRGNQVLIKTEVSLISPGTERAHLLGMQNTPRSFPRDPEGYNNIGRIIGTGKDVKEFKEGEMVASGANHASHVILEKDKILKVPEKLSPESVVFFNMGAIALNGIRSADIELGESVAVIGQGIIGQMASQLARMNGAFPVISIDQMRSRLEISKEYGSDFVIDAKEESVREIIQGITMKQGVDIVIEATGSPEPINDSFSFIKTRGRIILLGSPRGETTHVNFYPDIHRRGISIIGSHGFARPVHESSKHSWTWKDDAGLILELLASGRLKIDKFISKKLSYTKAKEAYGLILKEKNGVLGVLFLWE